MLSSIESAIPEPVRTVLRGIGQIYLQVNALTGLCIVLGIAVSSPLMAAVAVIGSVIGTLTAWVLKFDKEQIASGMYGFNSSLIAIATFFYFRPGSINVAMMVAGCITATLITYALSRILPFPTFTSPYWLTSWTLYLVGPTLGAVWVQPKGGPVSYHFIETVALGVSQSLFQANVWTGVLCLIGIALCNRQHALWVILGSTVGIVVANYHVTAGLRALDPETLADRLMSENVMLGLSSYNAALPAIALFRAYRSFIPPLLGILLSVPLTELIPRIGLPALNAPFVLSTWTVLALGLLDERTRRKIDTNGKSECPTDLSFPSGTDHLA